MVRFLLNTFPTWAVILGMMLVCSLIAWIIYSLIRHYLPKFLLTQDPHYARESIHLTSTLCAFLLAFMVVLLWQYYAKLEDSVVDEARGIGRIEVFSESLPLVNDQEISTLLEAYVDALINDEWVKMEHGLPSDRATDILLKLRYAIQNIDSHDPKLSDYRHQMLEDYNEIVFARDLRLDHLSSTIPGFFLFTILANLLGLFVLLCLLKPVDHKGSHHFFLFITSSLIGINLSFLIVLDYPFSGELSISNTPLTHIHFEPTQLPVNAK
jgi:hypothetical protein